VYKTAGIIAVTLFLLTGIRANAQEFGMGMYNSFKGFGLILHKPCRDGHVDRYQLFLDIYGIPSGRSGAPGAKFNYTRTSALKSITADDGVIYTMYVGPGISAGYLRDYEKGYYSDSDRLLKKNMGGMMALSGMFGCIIEFGKKIYLDITLTMEGGFHIRKGEEDGGAKMSFYKNGVYQSVYPEFGIIVKF